MFGKLVQNKDKAIKKGESKIHRLASAHAKYIERHYGKTIDSKFIGLNVFDLAKFLFESDEYYEYVKYADLVKYYDSKISSIKFTIIGIISLCAALLAAFVRPLWIPVVGIVLAILLITFLCKKMRSGESYGSFYQRTLVSFLYNIYPNPERIIPIISAGDE